MPGWTESTAKASAKRSAATRESAPAASNSLAAISRLTASRGDPAEELDQVLKPVREDGCLDDLPSDRP